MERRDKCLRMLSCKDFFIAARPPYPRPVVLKKPAFPAKDPASEGESLPASVCFEEKLTNFVLRLAAGGLPSTHRFVVLRGHCAQSEEHVSLMSFIKSQGVQWITTWITAVKSSTTSFLSRETMFSHRSARKKRESTRECSAYVRLFSL